MAFEVNDAVGGSFTIAVEEIVEVSIVHPLPSITSTVTISPFAIALEPAVEKVNVLVPIILCLIAPLSLKVYVAVATGVGFPSKSIL